MPEIKTDFFEDLEDKRQRICKAAIKIFKEKSFDKTTVSEIASEARVGKGTFYLYFDSKIKLLDFLLKFGTERLIEYVKSRIARESNPSKKIEEAIDAQLNFFNTYKDYFNFFVREIWVHREGLREQVEKLNEKYIVIFEDILREGIENKEFKNIDSETISSGLFGMLSFSSVHWVLFSTEFPVDRANESIKKVIFEGLLNSS